MEQTIVKLTGLAFLVISGFVAGAYYTMDKLTDVESYFPETLITMPSKEVEENCIKGEIIVIKKKQYFCMPVRPPQ